MLRATENFELATLLWIADAMYPSLLLTFVFVVLRHRYRAPGEHWTEKFKHVVGIIHTNYFAYAQEQPAALIRVSYEATLRVNQTPFAL